MENAYNELISTGAVGAFLVLVIIYHLKTVKELKREMKAKSIAHAEQLEAREKAHAEQIKAKDDKIEELHDKNHGLAIKGTETMKDWIEAIRSLRNL